MISGFGRWAFLCASLATTFGATCLLLLVGCKRPQARSAGLLSLETGNYYRSSQTWTKLKPELAWEAGQLVNLSSGGPLVRVLSFSGRYGLKATGSQGLPGKSTDEGASNPTPASEAVKSVSVDCSLEGPLIKLQSNTQNRESFSFEYLDRKCTVSGGLKHSIKYTSVGKITESEITLIGELSWAGKIFGFEEVYSRGYP